MRSGEYFSDLGIPLSVRYLFAFDFGIPPKHYSNARYFIGHCFSTVAPTLHLKRSEASASVIKLGLTDTFRFNLDMIKNRVSRSLYRSLLKMARNFEESPASKILLYRTDLYNTNKSAAAKYYTSVLSGLFEKDSYLFQPKGGSKSLVEIVRTESRAANENIGSAERLDAGFAALRKLSSLWSIYNTQESDEDEDDELELDDEEYSTALDSNVSLAPALSSGVLLLAHPMLQGPLHRSVILLLEHNSKGTYGVVINHRTGHSIQSSVKNLPESIIETFGHSSVAFGGMVRRLTYLHDVPQVGGISIPTCQQPLYAGGEISKALTFVKEARAACVVASTNSRNSDTPSSLESHAYSEENDPTERFRFFVGCCLWEGGNLEKELASGYWIPVYSKPDVVLDLAMKPAVLLEREQCDVSDVGIASNGALIADVVNEIEVSVDETTVKDPRETTPERQQKRQQQKREALPTMDEETLDAGMTRSKLDKIAVEEGSSSRDSIVYDENQSDRDYFSEGGEEEYSVDVWKALLRSLGDPYAAMADLPPWVSAKDVESADWK